VQSIATRAAVTFIACLLLMHFVTKPIELWINYMAFAWGAKYPWPYAFYAAEFLCLFILAGVALIIVGGIRRRQVAIAAMFGVLCMIALALRNPFLWLSPTTPSWPLTLSAYAHVFTAPLGAVTGAMLAARFFQKRSTPSEKSPETSHG
jgi:hypothetical protein